MRKNTVRRRIFISNAMVVLITLVFMILINIGIVNIYAESIENEWKQSMEKIMNKNQMEEMLEDWTIHRNSFVMLMVLDGVLCIGTLIVVSNLFTRNLTKHICAPLDKLEDGANRMRKNDLSNRIIYKGDVEFENVCEAFNDMQQHILEEQEKNKKYEKARTDMIAGISHDLKTPLTAIKGTIKAMMDGVVTTPKQQEKFLKTAYRRAGEMDILLNQLFYISKLETGNMPMNYTIIEIGSFINSYVKGKKEIIDSSEIDIEAVTNDVNENVYVDPEQLQRIFDNLLENSKKYGDKKPLHIKLSLQKKDNIICISFADNGNGIAEDKLPYIFDEFYRGDESRNQKDGSGLGLYIVKCLIEDMKGNVYAKNEEGLIVYMELPIKDKE
ncbi:cell wall metabolism sensor histidine kinase WalK [Clostridium sp. MSJ-8]|uniref:sensor histidine kinase n=1 Tax=Clostridium sp. MSJ-8 TaxID=2841510 RepID=UPI0020A11506|nr:HAMP domain-containing sensor histidine kinase [Clostridium sp. MSJ-8]